MSVYTAVTPAALADWLAPAAVGSLESLTGIAAGVENSNYFVRTATGEYVLTLFERLTPKEVDHYLTLMAHLAARGFPCPQPIPLGTGWSAPLLGKPAALVSRLPGHTMETPSDGQCRTLGRTLAQLHLAAADFPGTLPNPRGAAWRQHTAERLLPMLPPRPRARLRTELNFQAQQDFASLPQGLIHADLFRDNTLWQGDALSGVIDFYFAGQDALLFDLAVCANDWCSTPGQLDALLAGYISTRPLSAGEEAAWPAMRRAAALRFWLSRLEDLHFPRPGSVVTVKDPNFFGDMLQRLTAPL